MEATGIVRRVDDLGRIVIPKEIRRTLRIREGDPLEIFTDKDGGVVFKKYSQLGDVSDFAGLICDALSRNTGLTAVITDRDSCVAVGGAPKREREFFTGVCAECGGPARIPFQPTSDRPVYCSECYAARKQI